MDMSHPAFHMEAAFPFYLKNSIFWLLLGFAVLLIGAATFAYVEEIDEVDSGGGLRHWSDLPWPDGPTSYGARYARAFYFCWVSLTTVGYGDVTLHSQAGRGWACLYLFVCVVLIAAVVAKLSTLKADRMLKHRMREMLHMQLDWEMIKTLDKDGNGIDKLEFVVGMLELLGLVEAHDVEPFMEQFDALDVDGSGHLDRDDLRRMVCENREKYAAISSNEAESAANIPLTPDHPLPATGTRRSRTRSRRRRTTRRSPTTCRTRCAARTKTSPLWSAGAPRRRRRRHTAAARRRAAAAQRRCLARRGARRRRWRRSLETRRRCCRRRRATTACRSPSGRRRRWRRSRRATSASRNVLLFPTVGSLRR